MPLTSWITSLHCAKLVGRSRKRVCFHRMTLKASAPLKQSTRSPRTQLCLKSMKISPTTARPFRAVHHKATFPNSTSPMVQVLRVGPSLRHRHHPSLPRLVALPFNLGHSLPHLFLRQHASRRHHRLHGCQFRCASVHVRAPSRSRRFSKKPSFLLPKAFIRT